MLIWIVFRHKLQHVLGVSHDDAHDLDVKVTLTIDDITKTEPADLDQELFDKLFPDGSVKTATELREKIKEDAEKQFQQPKCAWFAFNCGERFKTHFSWKNYVQSSIKKHCKQRTYSLPKHESVANRRSRHLSTETTGEKKESLHWIRMHGT